MSDHERGLGLPQPHDPAPAAEPDVLPPPAGGEPDLAALVTAAREGDEAAWSRLVELFTPLVRAITRGYRLGDRDAEDVGQVVWLRLVEHIDRLRVPEALPGWIATTVRHECARTTRGNRRVLPVDPLDDWVPPLTNDHPDVDADLLHAEQVRAVRVGLTDLPPAQRDLLLLLATDPPPSYREISAMLDMPIGSIGPTRARSLARLGATPAVSEYLGNGSREHARRTCAA
ncbi:RNA polymerase sigma factor, sigma-70 family [Geodermatophilus africanus]|uniref:RNA polymerase sigma factor, sigma-70 family n=1 Tax=Geodermatophilus africanus TaxID=1137993 RepID=A0A1H3IY34_9ACTN|nr:sigma-70 family RNA polymerase sigma factor [Geodermatophilus africanus]SDY32636.1 RNA polymerase sigma factor, sigma-70 family [Geodermatophilus africanus]